MSYELRQGCTIEDADGVAINNVSAFWQQTWWRILFAAPKDAVLQKVTLRTPHNLLVRREVRRHQVVVDTATGTIVGYARWLLPGEHSSAWPEAQTKAVSDTEETRITALFNETKLPMAEYQDAMDALDDPIDAKQVELAPKEPYLKLEYLATHPDHQRRGISSMLVKSGLEQADRLGIATMVTAMGHAAASLYQKHGFKQEWDLEQSLKLWGHDDVYYTAILLRQPVSSA